MVKFLLFSKLFVNCISFVRSDSFLMFAVTCDEHDSQSRPKSICMLRNIISSVDIASECFLAGNARIQREPTFPATPTSWPSRSSLGHCGRVGRPRRARSFEEYRFSGPAFGGGGRRVSGGNRSWNLHASSKRSWARSGLGRWRHTPPNSQLPGCKGQWATS